MKILHFSDLHLDASFASLGMSSSIGGKRREELRNALRRIFEIARERSVDVVTIGGDLFEHDGVMPDTGRFLQDQFARVAPIRVIIAPGNHDCYVPDSVYHRSDWPSNVHIFKEPQFTPLLLGENITLWGVAHNSPSVRKNPLASFRPQGAGLHLLLFHGSDTGNVPYGKGMHAPFTLDDLRSSGARFALLGHYHNAALRPEDRPLYGYPGSPEPLGFDEEGTHYVLLLQVNGNSISPELIPINQVQYHQEILDVSTVNSSDDIRARISDLSAHWAAAIVRVTLTGTPHPDVVVSVETLLSECALGFRYLDIRNQVYPAYNLEELETQLTAKGRFVKKIREKIRVAQNDELRATRERALIFGLQALDGRKVDIT